MKKVFVSMPFHGKTEKEVNENLIEVTDILNDLFREERFIIIDNYHKKNVPAKAGRVWYLGDSIKLMNDACLVVFMKGWEEAKGCRIEHMICEEYGLNKIEL